MRYEKELGALYDAFLENEFDCSKNEILAQHITFRIGGPAPLTVWPSSRAQLIKILTLWRELGGNCPICVIGNGSNVLFSDDGYSGLVVITNRARRIVFEEDEADDREPSREIQSPEDGTLGRAERGLLVLLAPEVKGVLQKQRP